MLLQSIFSGKNQTQKSTSFKRGKRGKNYWLISVLTLLAIKVKKLNNVQNY
jgi:hypothetical protein